MDASSASLMFFLMGNIIPNNCQVHIYTWVENVKCGLMSSQTKLVPGWDLNLRPLDWEPKWMNHYTMTLAGQLNTKVLLNKCNSSSSSEGEEIDILSRVHKVLAQHISHRTRHIYFSFNITPTQYKYYMPTDKAPVTTQ